MKFDITQFCGEKRDSRSHIRSPFQWEGFDIATNGHVLIAVPHSDETLRTIEELSLLNPQRFNNLLNAARNAPVQPAPSLNLPAMKDCAFCRATGRLDEKKCVECDGEGELIFKNQFNLYKCECKSCESAGYYLTPGEGEWCRHCKGTTKVTSLMGGIHLQILEVNGLQIQPLYWHMIKDLPNLQTAALHDYNALAFRSNDTFGIIMTINQ